MKVLIQRSQRASVSVNDCVIGQIDHGLVLLTGIEKHDTETHVKKMAERVLSYRIFSDELGKMNLNVQKVEGGLLVISQFTLAANTQKGLRPSFSEAAPPEKAKQLFHSFVEALRAQYPRIETGEFAADMKVALVNDGPVTFMLEN